MIVYDKEQVEAYRRLAAALDLALSHLHNERMGFVMLVFPADEAVEKDSTILTNGKIGPAALANIFRQAADTLETADDDAEGLATAIVAGRA